MRVLLVDLEGVLIKGSWGSYESWLKSKGLDEKKVSETYKEHSGDLYRGKITGSGIIKIINKKLNCNLKTKDFFNSRGDIDSINKNLISAIKKIRNKGTKVYLLSDISKSSWYLGKRKLYFLKNFNQLILSFNTGFTKRQHSYYDYLAKRLNCKKQDFILLDDTMAIIEIARSCGLTVMHYKDESVIKKLQQLF